LSPDSKNFHQWYNEPDQQIKWGQKAISQGLYPTEKFLIEKHFKPDSDLLNVGCGGGREALALASYYNVTAIDFNKTFCESCKNTLEKADLKAEVRKMNATNLDFEDASFECLLMVGQLLGHIRPRKLRIATLGHAQRVLKPGGVAIVSTNAIELGIKFQSYFALLNMFRKFYNPLKLEPDDAFVGTGKFALLGNKKNQPIFHWYRTSEFLKDATEAGFKLVEFIRRFEFESNPKIMDRSTSGETFYVLKKANN